MIRINLLPVSDGDRLAQGRLHLLIFVGVLVMIAALLGLIFMATSAELEELKQRRDRGKAEVAQMDRDAKEIKALNSEAEQLQKQLAVLDELKAGRTGPVRMLDELKAMLNPPRNEEDRFAQLQKNWNVEWNTERLWLTSTIEKNQSFEMKGSAINADDVAEFLQRLTTSKHFQNIQLDFVEAKTAKTAAGRASRDIKYVIFRITGDLSYSGDKVVREDPKAKQPARGRPRNN